MMRALYSSVSGLKTHQTKMDVIGNNIANVNTVGFKSSRTTFSTMMYQSLSFASGANVDTGKGGVNSKQIGLGATFASTAVDIDTGGASESTGKAFDLKLSDKNSTSFYIVNTGTENVFTRAGAFYVDGAGNLCMESTGYQVMGWQVDANGNIRKDTVSPLRIMSAENQTSNPEYTTRAVCSGILDDNNSNVNSDKGYAMNLKIYDNLGYAYTAKFAAQKLDEKGQYTINLTDILDSNGKSILTQDTVRLDQLWGGGQGSSVDITDNYKVADGMGNALGAIVDQMNTTNGNLTYNFSSDYLNEIFAPDAKSQKLPSGLTAQLTISADGQTRTLQIVDGNNAPFDITNYNQPIAWIDTANNNISKTTTVQERLQEMYTAGQLTTETTTNPDGTTTSITIVSADQINALAQELGFAGTCPTTPRIIYTPAAAGGTASLGGEGGATVTGFDLNTFFGHSQTINLFDAQYLNQGYITITGEVVNDRGVFTTDVPKDAEIRYVRGEGGAWSYTVVTPSTDGYRAQFSTADGSLTYIGSEGNKTQTLRLSNFQLQDNPFSDIEIDFSTLKNLSNGGSSTAAMAGGNAGEGEGKQVGTMIGLSVDQSGRIYGSYSNGNTTLLGQIAVARFANASGLESIGENCYRTTMNSGQFDGIGVEMDSDGSTIDSGTLEMSNVDLATEFTMMITTQRGYQANSRVISTSDSILEELVNLKR
ncbi:MAG: flagellar hook-basal body complex protein [Eubacterium sp.]|nr:flagellar hook-basal body complex protein [Eubacterium sp.]